MYNIININTGKTVRQYNSLDIACNIVDMLHSTEHLDESGKLVSQYIIELL